MTKITQVIAREVLDSRGNPTIEVELSSEHATAIAIVPSGASTGTFEALELRDGNAERFNGKGVLKAVDNVNSILKSHLIGQTIQSQKQLDTLLLEADGTENKSSLGANALLGVSLCFSHLAAKELNIPLFAYFALQASTIKEHYQLPVPLMNVINGGRHADSGLDFQEFMIVPHGFSSFSDALRSGVEVFHALKGLLKNKGYFIAVGDEGGFAPQIQHNNEVLDLMMQAIEKAGYKPGEQISLALDVAASEFYDAQARKYTSFKGSPEIQGLSEQQMIDLYEDMLANYPVVSIEDGLAESDWYGWSMMQDLIGGKVQLVGDDIFVTNPDKVAQGIQQKCANAVLIKLNQIGTVSETVSTIKMTQENGWNAVVSHRSGETEDTSIADLAVGLSTGQIKTGSLSRTDRVAKYNQLLRIEQRLADKAIFKDVFK
jgi:enolase